MIDYRTNWQWGDWAWLGIVTVVTLLLFTLGLLVGRHQGYWKGVAHTEAQWLAHPTSP